MDLQHVMLVGVIIIGIAIPIVWFWPVSRVGPKDKATADPVDAAASLVIKDLRERFERSK